MTSSPYHLIGLAPLTLLAAWATVRHDDRRRRRARRAYSSMLRRRA